MAKALYVFELTQANSPAAVSATVRSCPAMRHIVPADSILVLYNSLVFITDCVGASYKAGHKFGFSGHSPPSLSENSQRQNLRSFWQRKYLSAPRTMGYRNDLRSRGIRGRQLTLLCFAGQSLCAPTDFLDRFQLFENTIAEQILVAHAQSFHARLQRS